MTGGVERTDQPGILFHLIGSQKKRAGQRGGGKRVEGGRHVGNAGESQIDSRVRFGLGVCLHRLRRRRRIGGAGCLDGGGLGAGGRILRNTVGNQVFGLLDEQRVVIDLASVCETQDHIAVLAGKDGKRKTEMGNAEHHRDIEDAVFKSRERIGLVFVLVCHRAVRKVKNQPFAACKEDERLIRRVVGAHNAAGFGIKRGIGDKQAGIRVKGH